MTRTVQNDWTVRFENRWFQLAAVHQKLVLAGRKVTVGVRPEHLAPSAPSAASFVGSVEMVEALGADTLVHVAVAGRTIIARLPQGTQAAVGEPIGLAAAPDRIYLFDTESGERLVPSA